jgi:glucose-6-phosphate 1-dehydrogenase
MRDMIQNHLLQIFALVAMEAPSKYSAAALRREKIKLLESVRALDPGHVVYGRYTEGEIAGERVRGYLAEEDVAEDTTTETFAQVELEVANWRWQDVPFVLRTGKRMAKRLSQVTVHFHCAPVSIFGGDRSGCAVEPNVLVITMQPEEGFDLYFEVKRPGDDFALTTQRLHFAYDQAFDERIPNAYETLLRDIVRGDQALFVSAEEAVEAWKIFEPLIAADIDVLEYEAGSWGPPGADQPPINARQKTDT